MAKHMYLRKADNELVSHCQCDKSYALISYPGQLDCPWCGCGWLFTCSKCRKAFTFAEAFQLDESWQETADRTLRDLDSRDPEPADIESLVGFLQILLKGIEPGQRYVYFDGWVIPMTAKGIRFKGRHSQHNLDFIPQVAALDNSEVLASVLSSSRYWTATAIEQDNSKQR